MTNRRIQMEMGDDGVRILLEHVRVFLNVLISSNSWEGECLIEEFPCVHLEFWSLTTLGLDGTGNVEGIGPMSSIESLGE